MCIGASFYYTMSLSKEFQQKQMKDGEKQKLAILHTLIDIIHVNASLPPCVKRRKENEVEAVCNGIVCCLFVLVCVLCVIGLYCVCVCVFC